MPVAVEQNPSLTSSKAALYAARSRAFSFCRVGTIGFAAVLVVFALSHVAAQAGLPAQSKDRHTRPARSKDGHTQPAQSKDRHTQPAQSKDGHTQPAQSKGLHAQPAQSKDGHGQRATDRRLAHRRSPNRVLHGPDYNPPYADILVDDNTGQVLHETNPDSLRHPASLTKIMTLYLLFEQLQAKKLSLNSRLQVSAHAAAQAPTKLGLKANETITVEDAIKGIVTRSGSPPSSAVGMGPWTTGTIVLDLGDPEGTGPSPVFCS